MNKSLSHNINFDLLQLFLCFITYAPIMTNREIIAILRCLFEDTLIKHFQKATILTLKFTI